MSSVSVTSEKTSRVRDQASSASLSIRPIWRLSALVVRVSLSVFPRVADAAAMRPLSAPGDAADDVPERQRADQALSWVGLDVVDHVVVHRGQAFLRLVYLRTDAILELAGRLLDLVGNLHGPLLTVSRRVHRSVNGPGGDAPTRTRARTPRPEMSSAARGSTRASQPAGPPRRATPAPTSPPARACARSPARRAPGRASAPPSRPNRCPRFPSPQP